MGITPETEAALKQLKPELEICPRCRCCEIVYEDCENCGGEGVTDHDCGEDVCCCLNPYDNVRCDICRGECTFPRCLGRCNSEGQHERRES